MTNTDATKPFDTTERADRRRSQRRALHCIDDHLVQGVLKLAEWKLPEIPDDARPYLESLLRDHADPLLEKLADTLAAVDSARRGDALIRFLDPNYPTLSPHLVEGADLNKRLEDLVEQARATSKPHDAALQSDYLDLAYLALLLVWADQASDDGYEDQRARAHRERVTPVT